MGCPQIVQCALRIQFRTRKCPQNGIPRTNAIFPSSSTIPFSILGRILRLSCGNKFYCLLTFLLFSVLSTVISVCSKRELKATQLAAPEYNTTDCAVSNVWFRQFYSIPDIRIRQLFQFDSVTENMPIADSFRNCVRI